MKLNYKRTILVGFAFFLISAFWQAYDATIALTLTNKFGMNQTLSGVIMALDNILALFLLPLFGTLSDKHKGKRGRRTPFIRLGTLVAAIALVALSFVDNMQLQSIQNIATVDDSAALEIVYDTQSEKELQTPNGTKFVLKEKFTREEFSQIRSTDDSKDVTNQDENKAPYTSYVVPARQAYAADQTKSNPTPLLLFIGILLILLVAMGIFRSPAVALMPDVTVKPLRSKANAVINLMGNAGGIIVLLLGMGFAFGISTAGNAMMSYTPYYITIAALMVVALVIFLTCVKEPKWVAEMQADSVRYNIEETEEVVGEKRKLSKDQRFSLICILLSVALWYFGYNAVTSKYSVYAPNVLLMGYSETMLIAQGSAIVAYLPAGMVASKIGRKKTILAGVVMLAAAFTVAAFMRAGSPAWLMYIMFALAGIAWATINVNSFPMVVEMCSGSDVGKYTGFYYTASMAAQTATPMISGFLMDQFGMTALFPYAAIFVALAFVTMALTKHGDSQPASKA